MIWILGFLDLSLTESRVNAESEWVGVNGTGTGKYGAEVGTNCW